MRIIVPMLILIMMTSSLAGCTSQTDGVNEFEEGDVDSILEFLGEMQEPEWINDRGNSSYQWQISLSDEQWLEIDSARLAMYHFHDNQDNYASRVGMIVSEEGYVVNNNDNSRSPIFGGNYSLCVNFDDYICYDYDRDTEYTIIEWTVIYRIHNVSGVNYYSGDNISNDNLNDEGNTNVTMEISYVPNGMDENARTTSVINIELYNNDAPNHVDSFLTHIENGNYNLSIFHRIIDNFMIQGGDIEGLNGYGGYAANWYGYCNGQSGGIENDCSMSDWTIPDEADNELTHTSGALSMAKTSSPNTGGSQFFIVPSDSNPSHLDGVHTVFGYVTGGLDSITDISEVDVNNNDKPTYDVIVESITID